MNRDTVYFIKVFFIVKLFVCLQFHTPHFFAFFLLILVFFANLSALVISLNFVLW